MLAAAGTFPIGLTASQVPVAMELGGPPGYDSTILSLLTKMDAVFPDAVPAPPNPSLCAGCDSKLFTLTVSLPAQPLQKF